MVPASRREAGRNKLRDAYEHGALGIAWQVLEVEAGVEGAHAVVERVGDDGVAADMSGGGNRAAQGEREQGFRVPMALVAGGDGKLTEQGDGNGIGFVAALRLGQELALDLRR